MRSLILASSIFVLAACADRQEPPPSVPGRVAIPRPEEPIGCTTTPPLRSAPAEFDDADPGAVRLFYDVLAPYGSWRDDPRLGLVWTPSHGGRAERGEEGVSDAFVPYATNGRWTHRAVPVGNGIGDEYVWVSDLAWGWVTFHFGRWTLAAPTHGGKPEWAWVAGRRYAGAWVDWRVPERASAEGVVGWGPTPPAILWRVTPRTSRAFSDDVDIRDAWISSTSYVAFATPYAYAHARDLFAHDLEAKLLHGGSALAVAHATRPALPPDPTRLGFTASEIPVPPSLDRGLQQAWMLATPASAAAVGAGPELASPPRLRTWVAGGPRFLDAH